MPHLLTNPQYWLDRAEEIRVVAERSVHAETKRTLEKLSLTTRFWRGGWRHDYVEAGRTTAVSSSLVALPRPVRHHHAAVPREAFAAG
jgi:hypothetical protein